MKKIKFTLKVVLMSAVSLILLTSVLLSSMVGSVNAALVKSLSKKLDFNVIPDSVWRYYLDDKDEPEMGIYKNAKSIKQDFEFTESSDNGCSAEDVIYHIAIPVYETGKYILEFTADISSESDNTAFTADLNDPVGCQVVSVVSGVYDYGADTNFKISQNTRLDNSVAASSSEAPGSAFAKGAQYGDLMFQNKMFHEASDNYQWRTVAPSRMETVELSFRVDTDDVTKGYVLWEWDFHGLKNPNTSSYVSYTIRLDNISCYKDSELIQDGPYFDFANMTYKNMNIIPTYNSSAQIPRNVSAEENEPSRYRHSVNGSVIETVQGHNVAGITRETGGRGTYVTKAANDSMVMQVEPVYYGWRYNTLNYVDDDGNKKSLVAEQPWVGSEDEIIENYFDGTDRTYDYSNPVVFNIPVKNVDAGKTYRVVFDFSIARQGTKTILNDTGAESTTNSSAEYADYATDLTSFFSTESAMKLNFQSYFYKNTVGGYGIETTHAQIYTRGYYSYKNKYKNTHWLMSYNDLPYIPECDDVDIKVGKALDKNIVSSVNDISWHNAVTYTEYNGENAITWLTLKNTSFTFNIQGYNKEVTKTINGEEKKVNEVHSLTTNDLSDLQWVWAIDALCPTAWFRLKIDNVRFEEVVDYGANIGDGTEAGIKIGNYEIKNAKTSFNGTMPYRGASGTGQTFLARGYSTGVDMPALHIYSPVYDLSNWDKGINWNDVTAYGKNPNHIYLSGWCVVDGGVDKYVWSPDNGKTWYDMIENDLENASTDLSILTQASDRINPVLKGDSKGSAVATYKTFTYGADYINADFRGYRVYADLSKYQYEHNVDIIFAAVPILNPDIRCEILRIENFNPSKNYRTYIDDVESDIRISSTGAYLNEANSPAGLTNMFGVSADTGEIKEDGGYALRTSYSNSYKDVRALISNMPVKKSLTVGGWAMVEGGVDKYLWSVDYGKTWNEFVDKSITNLTEMQTDQRGYWYDGSTETSTTLQTNAKFELKVDLSDYVGQIVDVIVVAKPVNSQAFCPVARVDNVAVYGDGGTFYTKLLGVTVGGATVTPTYFDVDGKPLNLVSKNTTAGAADPFALWNIGYGASEAKEFAYTIFEPYNVNVNHTRLYNNTIHDVAAGSNITIDGYIACKGGVTEYRYTVDNGEYTFENGKNYQTIARSGEYTLHESGVTNAKKSDASFVGDDFANGNFSADNGGENLSVTIPTELAGKTVNFLVYAVHIEENGVETKFPVFNIKLKIT